MRRRHDERHNVHRRTAVLVCSVVLSGQAPKPHNGAATGAGLDGERAIIRAVAMRIII
jgi:hypothetical protein